MKGMKEKAEQQYKGRNVLVTGHTGFKGTWLCEMLHMLGANVTGYALHAPTEPSLFQLAGMDREIESVIGDIRDFEHLKETVKRVKPDFIFHLAAQPIVRDGYKNPRYTYETNVMGTANLLECVRLAAIEGQAPRSVVNITTDKVYQNNEWCWSYRENEPLDGFDPYSNSKSCSELVTHCYRNSFFSDHIVRISTARAGNVIGGGDFAPDRIIPDCVRAVSAGQKVIVRNPNSIRPYQHVLEPLAVYLMIAQEQYMDPSYIGCYNVGPDECDCVTTGELVQLFCEQWGNEATWTVRQESNAPHEAICLKLDCSHLKSRFGWKPKWQIKQAVHKTCEFSKRMLAGEDVMEIMRKQITEFME